VPAGARASDKSPRGRSGARQRPQAAVPLSAGGCRAGRVGAV